jgi:hypothetical protein
MDWLSTKCDQMRYWFGRPGVTRTQCHSSAMNKNKGEIGKYPPLMPIFDKSPDYFSIYVAELCSRCTRNNKHNEVARFHIPKQEINNSFQKSVSNC